MRSAPSVFFAAGFFSPARYASMGFASRVFVAMFFALLKEGRGLADSIGPTSYTDWTPWLNVL